MSSISEIEVRLRSAVNGLDNISLFSSSKEVNKDILEACTDYLSIHGYVVTPPIHDLSFISSSNDLRNYFFTLARSKYSMELPSLSRGEILDKTIIKHFINSRMVGGATKRFAIVECANIMKTVFDNEEKFNFDGPISLIMFDPGVFSWVIDRALSILSGEYQRQEDEYVDNLCQEAVDNLNINWSKL